MFERRWHAALLVLWAVSTSVCAAADEQAKLPPKEKLHVYLLMGQSNMAGRGRMTEVAPALVPAGKKRPSRHEASLRCHLDSAPSRASS